MKTLTSILLISFMFWANTSKAQSCHESGPQPHAMAPIGIMGGHMHNKGHFMASYRFMTMNMSGMSNNGNALSSEAVLSNWMMSPSNMNMQMHMVGLMYSPTERITIMAMGNYLTNSMIMESDVSHDMGMTHDHSDMNPDMTDMTSDETMELKQSTMRSQGFGDTRLSALIRLNQNETHCLHAISGFQLPTGKINLTNASNLRMPYGMQNGTGSVGAFLGLNYSWLMPKYLVGAQAQSSAPLHKNSENYMSSVRHDMSFWVARKWFNWMSTSVRIHGHYQTGIRGSDALINPMMAPAAIGSNEELFYTDISAGINLKPMAKWRIGIEAGMPFYQLNSGTHLNQAATLTAGLQFMMH